MASPQSTSLTVHDSWRANCSFPGCPSKARSIYARLCERHRTRKRLWGDPQLTGGFKKKQLKPYLKEARAMLRRTNREKVESALVRLQTGLGDVVRDDLAERRRTSFQGEPWVIQALEEIDRVLSDLDPIKSGTLIAAMYLARRANARRWTDRSFLYDLVRQWRKQSNISIGIYWDSKREQAVGKYRDLRPQTVETIGEMLVQTYKSFVALVLGVADKKAQDAADTKALLSEGFSSLS